MCATQELPTCAGVSPSGLFHWVTTKPPASCTARTIAWVSEVVFGSALSTTVLPLASTCLIWVSCRCESPSSVRVCTGIPTEAANISPPLAHSAWYGLDRLRIAWTSTRSFGLAGPCWLAESWLADEQPVASRPTRPTQARPTRYRLDHLYRSRDRRVGVLIIEPLTGWAGSDRHASAQLGRDLRSDGTCGRSASDSDGLRNTSETLRDNPSASRYRLRR